MNNILNKYNGGSSNSNSYINSIHVENHTSKDIAKAIQTLPKHMKKS